MKFRKKVEWHYLIPWCKKAMSVYYRKEIIWNANYNSLTFTRHTWVWMSISCLNNILGTNAIG